MRYGPLIIINEPGFERHVILQDKINWHFELNKKSFCRCFENYENNYTICCFTVHTLMWPLESLFYIKIVCFSGMAPQSHKQLSMAKNIEHIWVYVQVIPSRVICNYPCIVWNANWKHRFWCCERPRAYFISVEHMELQPNFTPQGSRICSYCLILDKWSL